MPFLLCCSCYAVLIIPYFFIPRMLCTTYRISSLPYRLVSCNLHIPNVSLVHILNPYPFSALLSPPSFISMITSLSSPVPANSTIS